MSGKRKPDWKEGRPNIKWSVTKLLIASMFFSVTDVSGEAALGLDLKRRASNFPLTSCPFFYLLWVRSATQDINYPALLDCVAGPGQLVWKPGPCG